MLLTWIYNLIYNLWFILIVVLPKHVEVPTWLTVYVSSAVSSLLPIHNSVNYWSIFNTWNWFWSSSLSPLKENVKQRKLFRPLLSCSNQLWLSRVCIEIEITNNDWLSWPSLSPPYENIPNRENLLNYITGFSN